MSWFDRTVRTSNAIVQRAEVAGVQQIAVATSQLLTVFCHERLGCRLPMGAPTPTARVKYNVTASWITLDSRKFSSFTTSFYTSLHPAQDAVILPDPPSSLPQPVYTQYGYNRLRPSSLSDWHQTIRAGNGQAHKRASERFHRNCQHGFRRTILGKMRSSRP